MTAPLSWTAPSPAPAPPLVVRPDRRSARRWMAVTLGLNGVLSLVCLVGVMWASSATGMWWGGSAIAITLAGCVFQMVFHAFFYGRLLGTETIAEIGPAGIRAPTKRWVPQALPWSSVAVVMAGWRAVVVKPVPGAGPTLVIPIRASDTDSATVRAAVAHFSGGRL